MYQARKTKTKSSASEASSALKERKKQKWQLQTYLETRDFQGAITLLRFQAKHGERTRKNTLWTAYSLFHMGEYLQALRLYEEILSEDEISNNLDDDKMKDEFNSNLINIACCYLYLNDFDIAKQVLKKLTVASPSIAEFERRLQLHLAQRGNDTETVARFLTKDLIGSSNIHEQLAAAGILFRQRNFQAAIDIYKRLLAREESHAAIQVYLAMCYYHLEYYDISAEMLATYMSLDPFSIVAKNLQACNTYHLADGHTAEKILNLNGAKSEHALIEHNLIAFRDGDRGAQLWRPFVGVVPEAHLNLAIYHLKNTEFNEAFELLESMEPSQPSEYILKAIVHTWKGQEPAFAQSLTNEHLFLSEKFYEMVGAAPSECDTIRGRQAMSTYYLLRKEYETAIVYLKSIAIYHVHDDAFNWNYGLALAATGGFSEGETILIQVQNPQWKQQYVYMAWLARCHIRSIQQSHLAWELYLKVQNSVDALKLLKLIANEYYLMADYYYAAKAFDVLERVDPDPEYWEAKRGACVGYFHKAVTTKCDHSKLLDVVSMLDATKNSQGILIARSLRAWCETTNFFDK